MYKSARTRNLRFTIAVILLSVILLSLLVGCNGSYRTESLLSMGTALNLVAYTDKDTFEELVAGTKEILSYAESLTAENGTVTKFNKADFGEKIELDEIVYSILNTVKTDRLLDGYNPLVYPLVDLWGFSPRFRNDTSARLPYDREKTVEGGYPLPNEEYVTAFLKLTDLDGLVLVEENGKYYCVKNIPSVTVEEKTYKAQLDLGGCIKGYCSDRIKELYDSLGIKYGYATFGTSSITLLLNKTGEWTLSLTDPNAEEKTFYSLKLSSGNASTSGDYQNCYSFDGVNYCHIIGKDGYPVHNARSVTVIGQSALYCDMASTALMTVPLENLEERVSALKENSYSVVYCYGEETLTTVSNAL